MDAIYIKAFVESISNVFTMMVQLPIEINAPTLRKETSPSFDVSGIIGLSGDIVGSCVLSFPKQTALKIVEKFCGQLYEPDDPDFADAIGELTNMVSGGAKGSIEGKNASISCPSVIIGEGHTVAIRQDTPCVVIPCSTDLGDFVIEIAIKEAAVNVAAA